MPNEEKSAVPQYQMTWGAGTTEFFTNATPARTRRRSRPVKVSRAALEAAVKAVIGPAQLLGAARNAAVETSQRTTRSVDLV